MKSLLSLLLLLPLALFSCKKDDTGEVCTGGCTVIEGTVTTAGGAPVSGVSLEVRSLRDPKGLAKTRKIARTQTDAAGHYRMEFALDDYESGPNAVATVYLKFEYDENSYLPLGMGNTDMPISAPWMSSRPFENREVQLVKDIYLPKKATAPVRLEGLNPPVDVSSNNFIVTASGRAGMGGYTIALYQIMATANPTLSDMLVPGDDSVTFHLEKRRPGGIVDQSDTTVWMPAGGRPITFTY